MSDHANGESAASTARKPLVSPKALLGVGLLVAAGIAAFVGMPASQVEATPIRPPEQVYASTCGYCHGQNVGPIILGRKLPADAVKLMVRSGLNSMPAFRPTEISPAELDQLARWIELSSKDPKEKGK